MKVPSELRYTKDHEWLRVDGNEGVVGITDFAQDALGDVVFVELPAVGTALRAGQTFGVVESNKTVSDLYAPLDGTVVAVNEALRDQPEVVNQDPYGAGWMVRIAISGGTASADLLDAAAYTAHVASEQAK
jgi:glycine cleavage system H protein